MLGGLLLLRDAVPPPGAAPRPGGAPGPAGSRRRPRLRLRVRRVRSGALRLRVTGPAVRRVRRVSFFARRRLVRRDARRPFRARLGASRQARGRATRIEARIVLRDGARLKRVRRVGPRRR